MDVSEAISILNSNSNSISNSTTGKKSVLPRVADLRGRAAVYRKFFRSRKHHYGVSGLTLLGSGCKGINGEVRVMDEWSVVKVTPLNSVVHSLPTASDDEIEFVVANVLSELARSAVVAGLPLLMGSRILSGHRFGSHSLLKACAHEVLDPGWTGRLSDAQKRRLEPKAIQTMLDKVEDEVLRTDLMSGDGVLEFAPLSLVQEVTRVPARLMVVERWDGDLRALLRDARREGGASATSLTLNGNRNLDLNLELVRSIVFQVAAALHVCQTAIGMSHNDLHLGNVLYSACEPGGWWLYRLPNRTNPDDAGASVDFAIPCEGLVVCLWDFGYSCCRDLDKMRTEILRRKHMRSRFDRERECGSWRFVDITRFLSLFHRELAATGTASADGVLFVARCLRILTLMAKSDCVHRLDLCWFLANAFSLTSGGNHDPSREPIETYDLTRIPNLRPRLRHYIEVLRRQRDARGTAEVRSNRVEAPETTGEKGANPFKINRGDGIGCDRDHDRDRDHDDIDNEVEAKTETDIINNVNDDCGKESADGLDGVRERQPRGDVAGTGERRMEGRAEGQREIPVGADNDRERPGVDPLPAADPQEQPHASTGLRVPSVRADPVASEGGDPRHGAVP